MNGNPYSNSGNINQNNEDNQKPKTKSFGEIVQSVLHDGDLNQLKEIVPAIQNTIKTEVSTNVPAYKKQKNHLQRQSNYPYGGYLAKSIKVPKGLASIVFGSIGVFTFGVCAIVFGAMAAAGVLEVAFGVTSLGSLTVTLLFLLLMGKGFGKRKLGKTVETIYKLFLNKKVYTYKELAILLGKTEKQLKKDVRKARARGMMTDVYTDADETSLMYGGDTYEQYLNAERMRNDLIDEVQEHERLLANPETADLEIFRSEGEATIRKIRKANVDIPGEEISDKLSRLEATCTRIFFYVDKHPEKLPETRKFMAYYLPTTLKLVEKYQQFEAMDYQPENVLSAKKDIELALDTIDIAFKNLFESLNAHDTLDIVTDIEVLKNMLEQEGLTSKKFDIKPKNETDNIENTIELKNN